MIAHEASIPRDGRHLYPLRIYYEDTDAGGIVYHANYLRFAERARTEALRDMGIPHAEMVGQFGLMFVVRRIEVDYQRAARLDDSLTVVTESVEVGGASVVLGRVKGLRPARGATGVLGAWASVRAVGGGGGADWGTRAAGADGGSARKGAPA